jgi:hypothetical protein
MSRSSTTLAQHTVSVCPAVQFTLCCNCSNSINLQEVTLFVTLCNEDGQG